MAHRKSPAPVIGRVIEPIYRAEVARRNRAYDAGRGVDRIEVPVVSVGNISVGGTGKTPMVMWVVERLRAMGRKPAIAMRGYGSKRDGVSDEEAEYASRLTGIPIVARPDRLQGLRELQAVAPDTFDCVVLDDGFQHRRMGRDLDIVLLDATRDPFADRCLPGGWLREPVASVARAGAIVATRVDLVDPSVVRAMLDRVRSIAPRAVVATATHEWDGVQVVEPDGTSRHEPASWIRGRRFIVATGIANPGAFLAQLEREGGAPIESVALADHAPWTDAQVARVGALSARHGGTGVLVTDKDWVKIRGRVGGWGVPVVRPRVRMSFRSGEGEVLVCLKNAMARRSGDTIRP